MFAPTAASDTFGKSACPVGNCTGSVVSIYQFNGFFPGPFPIVPPIFVESHPLKAAFFLLTSEGNE